MFVFSSELDTPRPSLTLRRYLPFRQLQELVRSASLQCYPVHWCEPLIGPAPVRIWASSWSAAPDCGLARWRQVRMEPGNRTSDALAIVTTVGALRRSVIDPTPFYIGSVTSCRADQVQPACGALAQACRANNDQVDGHEVRLLVAQQTGARGDAAQGCQLDVMVRALVHQIEVSPFAAPDLNKRVRLLLAQHGYNDIAVWQANYLQVA